MRVPRNRKLTRAVAVNARLRRIVVSLVPVLLLRVLQLVQAPCRCLLQYQRRVVDATSCRCTLGLLLLAGAVGWHGIIWLAKQTEQFRLFMSQNAPFCEVCLR